MSRLFIVDQSLKNLVGHHAEYSLSLARQAVAIGWETTVLANVACRLTDEESIRIVPAFGRTSYEAQRVASLPEWDMTVSQAEWPFFADLQAAMHVYSITADDSVFIHSIGFIEVDDLLRIWMSIPSCKTPFLHLLIRRDYEETAWNAELRSNFLRSIRALNSFACGRIAFYTDTEELSEQFSRATGIPFVTLPIPFDHDLLDRAAERRAPESGHLTLTYLGDARTEKGYLLLPQAVAHLTACVPSIRFRIQSNFNVPGGEPGIREARDKLSRLPGVTLLEDPLTPEEYYDELVRADIILIPYSHKNYARRSSGVFSQALAAAKIPVIPAATSMDYALRRLGVQAKFAYETPPEFARVLEDAVRKFAVCHKEYQDFAPKWRGRHSPAQAIAELAERDKALRAGIGGTRKLRILHVVDGDEAFNRTGTALTQSNQRRFLTDSGYDVVTVYMVKIQLGPDDIKAWSARARNYGLQNGASFVWLTYMTAPYSADSIGLEASIRRYASLTIPESLTKFVISHKIDAVLFNYIASIPFVDALPLASDIPMICELHDIQSYQYALHRGQMLDAKEFAKEASLISLVEVAISVNGLESEVLRDLVPTTPIHTVVPHFLDAQLSARDLAGPQDLAEVVSSAGSELQFVDFVRAWETADLAQVQSLFRSDTLDLFYVSSWHEPNVKSLEWFLEEVFEPYLAKCGFKLVIAGNICSKNLCVEWRGRYPEQIFLIGRVETLRPLYAAARVVILPVIYGSGVNIKTIEAFCFGKPIVATSHAVRGLGIDVSEMQLCDAPEAFADRVIELLTDEDERRRTAELAWHLGAARRSQNSYYGQLRGAFVDALGGAALAAPQASVTSEFQFLEWGVDYSAIGRFLRILVEENYSVLDWHWAALRAMLRVDKGRKTFEEVVVSLLVDGDAPILATRQFREGGGPFGVFVSFEMAMAFLLSRWANDADWALSHASKVVGCRGMLDTLAVSGASRVTRPGPPQASLIEFERAESPEAFQLAVVIGDVFGSRMTDSREREESLLSFYDDLFAPFLAGLDVAVVIVGDVRSDLVPKHPKLCFAGDVEDMGSLLESVHVVYVPRSSTPWHPTRFRVVSALLRARKPFVCSRDDLWFVPDSVGRLVGASGADEAAAKISALASGQHSREEWTINVSEATREWLRDVNRVPIVRDETAIWASRQFVSQFSMIGDGKVHEWNANRSLRGEAFYRVAHGMTAPDDMKCQIVEQLSNPETRRVWEADFNAISVRMEAPILEERLGVYGENERVRLSALRNVDDLIRALADVMPSPVD